MEDEDFQQLLLDYAATANLPKNNGDWDVIDAKFPELEKYDRDVLHSYVLTYNQANQPDNMEDLGVINAKFPELFPVKKKDEAQVAPSVSVADGEETSAVSPSISDAPSIDSGTPEPLTAKTPDEVPFQEVQFLTGDFGNAINSVPFLGDIIDDSARAIAQGKRQGNVVNDALSVMSRGAAASDEDVLALIAEVQRMEELGPSEEFNNFQKVATEEGGVFGFLKALATEPQAVPEVFLQSMSALVNPASAAVALPIVSGGGLLGGPGGAAASLPYAMAAAGTTLETALTFAELLQEEVKEKGLEFDLDGVNAVLDDTEALNRIRRKSAVRGGVIGTVDALTGRVSTKVAQKALLTGSKATAVAKTGFIEAVGGGLGEAAGSAAIGKPIEAVEVGLETFGGTTGTVTSLASAALRPGKYKVNGETVDRAFVQDILKNATPEELANLEISVENDKDLKAEMQEQQLRSQLAENLPRNFSEEANAELLDLEYERAVLTGKRDSRSKKKRIDEIDARIDEIFESEKMRKAQEAGMGELRETGLIVGGEKGFEVTRTVTPVEQEVATMEGGEVAGQETDIGAPLPPPEPSGKAFEAPKKTRYEATRDLLIRKFQDKFIDVFRLQDAVTAARGDLSQDQDFRMAEELFYGRAADKIEKLEGKLEDITSGMKEAGLTMDQFDEYLYARHAKERNSKIFESQKAEADKLRSKENKTSKEKNRLKQLEERMRNMDGSGMSDAEADAILQSYEKEFGDMIGPDQKSSIQNLHDLVMEITAENRALAVEAGLISQEEADRQFAEQPNYVPLQGFAVDESGAQTGSSYVSGGQGFNVRGKEGKRAKGRQSKAANPLAQLVTNSATLRIRAERNMALQKLHNLVAENPNPDVWTVLGPGQKPDPTRSVGVKINGEEHFIQFENSDHVKSLKEMGVEDIGMLGRFFRGANNWLRRSFTTINPEFVLTNFSRDIQSAVLNAVAETDIPGGQISGRSDMVQKMVKRVPQTLKALMQEEVRGKDSALSQYYAEFKEDGGKTGWAYAKSLAQRKTEIENSLRGAEFKGKGFLNLLEGVNDAVENSIRLAAYIEAREAGVTREKAAQLAKNITVNFNKSGTLGPAANSLFLFFNAAVQGSARTVRSLKSPKVQKAVGLMTLSAAMLDMANRGMSGEDEDGVLWYDKISPYKKERSIIIMTGTGPDDYVSIPLPYGFGAFWSVGTAMSAVANEAMSVDQALGFTARSVITNFSPVQLSEGDNPDVNALRTITPTVLTPLLDRATNQTYYGGKVYREQFPGGTPKPESELAYRAPRLAIEAARAVNVATDGSPNVPGKIDYNPDKDWYTLDFAMGSAGKTAIRTGQLAKDIVTGAPIKTRNVPFARVFLGSAQEDAYSYDIDRFEANRVEVEQLFNEFKSKSKEDPEAGRYTGIPKLKGQLRKAENLLKVQRKKLRDAQDIENYAERSEVIQNIREAQRKIMMNFNKEYNRVRKEKD